MYTELRTPQEILEWVHPGLRINPECRCGNLGTEEHTCPYNEDIHGDYETTCNCCASCMHECCMDI